MDGAPVLPQSLDIEKIRAAFPILSREIHGERLVFLDSAASAQKPRPVIDAMTRAMETSYANVHRGLHTLSNEATVAYEAARATTARFLNAASPEEIVFTSGGTDSFNLAATCLGVDHLNEGDEIILSVMEHHANIVPWHFLRERKGVVLKWLDVNDDGEFDLDAYSAMFTERTKLVALSHMSNVMGGLAPAKDLARIAHAHDALILFDGCQATVHGAVDVQDIDADFYVATCHKLYGPSGLGILYAKRSVLEGLPPYRGGGEMIEEVSTGHISYNDPPQRFEAGTPAIVEAIGFAAAIDWMSEVGVDAIAAHEARLSHLVREALDSLDFVTVYGKAAGKAPIWCFNVDGAHPHDVSTILDRSGVAIRAGHHCAQPLMDRLGAPATCRASFGVYNDADDVDALVEALEKTHKMFA